MLGASTGARTGCGHVRPIGTLKLVTHAHTFELDTDKLIVYSCYR